MSTLHITRGLPGTGKTTFAREWVAEHPQGRVRINRDDIRAMVHGGCYSGRDTEMATTAVQHASVRRNLHNNRDVICDDTNLNARFVKALLKIAQQTDAEVQFHDFNPGLAEALQRDLARGENGVGGRVILSMHERYLAQYEGELPPLPELLVGAVEQAAGEPYVPNWDLLKAIIVDIDGTLAHNDGHRSFYDYSKVLADSVVAPVRDLVWDLIDEGYMPVIMSGREESCREDTVAWLDKECGFDEGSYAGPFMRAIGDNRDDAVVKLELFDREVRDHFNVRYVLDDRNRVVKMWRSLGLTVLQVADGDF